MLNIEWKTTMQLNNVMIPPLSMWSCSRGEYKGTPYKRRKNNFL